METYTTRPFFCDVGFRITATDDDVTLSRTIDGFGGGRGAAGFNAYYNVLKHFFFKLY